MYSKSLLNAQFLSYYLKNVALEMEERKEAKQNATCTCFDVDLSEI